MIHPDDQPIANLVKELQRGDIPATYENTGGGVMCCILPVQTLGGERWEWYVGLANEPEWGYDVTCDGEQVLDIPWQIRRDGGYDGHPLPTIDASARDVARWLMAAITEMHGPTPAFIAPARRDRP